MCPVIKKNAHKTISYVRIDIEYNLLELGSALQRNWSPYQLPVQNIARMKMCSFVYKL